MRLIQYFSKFLTRFGGSEEWLKLLNGLAASLSDARLAMNLLKGVEYLMNAKNAKQDPENPLERTCKVLVNTGLGITLLRMDGIWLASRKIITFDNPTEYNNSTFRIWMMAIFAGILGGILKYRRVNAGLRKLEIERKRLVALRRQKDNVDAEMRSVFDEKKQLERESFNVVLDIIRNLCDIPLGANLAGVGEFEASTAGFFATISSAIALKMMIIG